MTFYRTATLLGFIKLTLSLKQNPALLHQHLDQWSADPEFSGLPLAHTPPVGTVVTMMPVHVYKNLVSKQTTKINEWVVFLIYFKGSLLRQQDDPTFK